MKKRVPYKDAVKLAIGHAAFQAAERLIAPARAQQDRVRQRLADIHEFKDIPIDKVIDIKLEKGPDKKGMIVVEWKDE